MQEKLHALFEMQHFVENENLAKLIAQTEQRMKCALPFEELDDDQLVVNAAGDLFPQDKEGD